MQQQYRKAGILRLRMGWKLGILCTSRSHTDLVWRSLRALRHYSNGHVRHLAIACISSTTFSVAKVLICRTTHFGCLSSDKSESLNNYQALLQMHSVSTFVTHETPSADPRLLDTKRSALGHALPGTGCAVVEGITPAEHRDSSLPLQSPTQVESRRIDTMLYLLAAAGGSEEVAVQQWHRVRQAIAVG